nr:ATP-binding cassette domain-containing protein [Pseudonocardia sp. SID8383]
MESLDDVGVVGETGSGKSTPARSLIQAPRPQSGEIEFQDVDLMGLRRRDLVRARRSLQMVYQDPLGSLNPRRRVAELVAEPLVGYRGAPPLRARRVDELISVGPDACADRLVPKDMMRAVLHSAPGVPEERIEIGYPGETLEPGGE